MEPIFYSRLSIYSSARFPYIQSSCYPFATLTIRQKPYLLIVSRRKLTDPMTGCYLCVVKLIFFLIYCLIGFSLFSQKIDTDQRVGMIPREEQLLLETPVLTHPRRNRANPAVPVLYTVYRFIPRICDSYMYIQAALGIHDRTCFQHLALWTHKERAKSTSCGMFFTATKSDLLHILQKHSHPPRPTDGHEIQNSRCSSMTRRVVYHETNSPTISSRWN